MLYRLVAIAAGLIANIRFLFDYKLRLNKIPSWEPPVSGLIKHPMQESVKKALEYPLGGVSVLWGPSGSGKTTLAFSAAQAHSANGHYVAVLVCFLYFLFLYFFLCTYTTPKVADFQFLQGGLYCTL